MSILSRLSQFIFNLKNLNIISADDIVETSLEKNEKIRLSIRFDYEQLSEHDFIDEIRDKKQKFISQLAQKEFPDLVFASYYTHATIEMVFPL
ncbi:MAG: hypothetical protein J6J60_08320 [Clostridia bacterium]|nr:hypothetical protein [Clostridia bacterium]